MPPKKVSQPTLFAYSFKRSTTSEKSDQSFSEHEKQSGENGGTCEVQPDSSSDILNPGIPESDSDSESSGSFKEPSPPKKAKSDKKTKKYLFQKSWYTYPDGSKRKWLKYDEQKKIMTCECCIELYQNRNNCSSMPKCGGSAGSSFILGCSSLRYTSVLAHEKATSHKQACEAYFARRAAPFETPIGKSLKKMDEKELEKRKFQFVTAFYIAQQELPFSHFEPLLALQDKNFNANLCSNYANNKQCKYFIEYIAEIQRNEIAELLKKNNFFSTLNDSSTDSSVSEQEVVYVKTLNENYEPVTKFLAVKKLSGGDATSIKQAVINSIENDGDCSDWRDRLVCCTVDGASVMTGRLNGMVKQVQEEVPHLIGVHCTAHRLELAIHDAAKQVKYVTDIDNTLQELYKVYHYSPKNWACLQTTGVAIGVKVLKPTNILGTRWVSHRHRAVIVLLNNWAAIVTHLSQLQQGRGEQAARAKGLYNTLTSVRFVLFIKLLEMIYGHIEALSCVLQDNKTTLEDVALKLELTTLALDNIKVERGAISTMEKEMVGGTKWKGIPLNTPSRRRDCSSPISKVVEDGAKLIQSIKQEIDRRFQSMALHNQSPLKAFSRLFVPKHWPVEKSEYSTYGDEDLELLQGRYGSLLGKKGYDGSLATLRNEMTELMLTVNILHHPTYKMTFRMWSPFLVMNKSQDVQTMKNILALLQIYMVIPSSTAEAERGFSLMQRIKTDHRSSLSSSTMTDLMMIKLCASELHSFDPVPSISMWYDSGKRRLTRRRSTMSKVAQAALSTPDRENASGEDVGNQTQSDSE